MELKIRRGDLPPALDSHMAKYRSLFPKLALIFHLADEEGMEPEVPLTQAQRAAGFCAYLEEHARRVYGCAANQQQLAAALCEKLQTGVLGERSSLRDVYLRGWASMDTAYTRADLCAGEAEKARSVLVLLVDAGWVRKAPCSDRHVGRPCEEYVINPRIR